VADLVAARAQAVVETANGGDSAEY
jgi:hypothetical protein